MKINEFMEELKRLLLIKIEHKYEVTVEYLKCSKVYVLTIIVKKYNRCGYVRCTMGNTFFNDIKKVYGIYSFMSTKIDDLIRLIINKEFELEARFGKIPTEEDKWIECREEDREEMEALYRR